MDTNYLAHRNSTKSKRIVIPKIVFRSKRQFHNIVNAVDVIRSDSQFLHFLAVERSVMIYTLHSLFKTNALDFTKAFAIHTFDTLIPNHVFVVLH